MTALLILTTIAVVGVIVAAAVLPLAWQAREKRCDTGEFERSEYGRRP